jgi:hypothetical protein
MISAYEKIAKSYGQFADYNNPLRKQQITNEMLKERNDLEVLKTFYESVFNELQLLYDELKSGLLSIKNKVNYLIDPQTSSQIAGTLLELDGLISIAIFSVNL